MPAQTTIPLETSLAAIRLVDVSPFLIEFVTVQGVGFRCSAYRDQAGKWHDAFTNDELFGEIQIVE